MQSAYRCTMTISEELHFSVLTAPIAAVDRRSLSQAWFSALYGTHQRPAGRAAKLHDASGTALPQPRGTAEEPAPAATAHTSAADGPKAPVEHTGRGVPIERRSPRSELAMKIERRLQPTHAPLRGKTFSLDGALGRVRILLQSKGNRHNLIAICPRGAQPQVAAALAQARYALALRGIQLDVRTREEQPCR